MNQGEQRMPASTEERIHAKDEADQHTVEAVGAQVQRALRDTLRVACKQTDQPWRVPLLEEQAPYPENEGQPDRQAHTVPGAVHQAGAIMLGCHGG